MTYTYYHNPKCSKSREGLQLLQKKKIEFAIREYLKEPLNKNEIGALITKLGLEPDQVVRKKEKCFKELGLAEASLSKTKWCAILAENPVLIERPILEAPKRAVIGRPTERLLEVLK